MSQGHCKECNSEDIEYDVIEVEESSVYYPYVCNECGHAGKEYYDLEYSEST